MISSTPTRSLVWILLLLIAAGPLAAQDWSGRGRAQGQITDENGKGIQGTITLLQDVDNPESGPPPFETNKKGHWSYLGLDGGEWTVLIDAPGYKASQGSFKVNIFAPVQPLKVKLERNPVSSITDGDALMDSGDYAGARAKYQEAMMGLDATAQARLSSRIGETYLKEGDFATARTHLQRALSEMTPEEQAGVHVQIGNTYQMEQNFAAARSSFEAAMPYLPKAAQIQLLMATARGYDLEENRQGAIDTLRRGLESFPGEESMIRVIADLLTREGQEDEARVYLEQLPEGAALPADMLLNIGIRLYNEGKTAEASEYFNQAVDGNPDLAAAYYYRGLTLLATEQNDAAAADFRRLLELEPEGEHSAEASDFLKFLEPGE